MPKKRGERKNTKRSQDLAGLNNSPDSPTHTKKKRRTTSNPVGTQGLPATPPSNDLVPPPLTGYGDTVVAANPFDDTPHCNGSGGPMTHPPMTPMSMSYMNNMNMGPMGMKGMGGPMGPMSGPMGPGHMPGHMGGSMGPGHMSRGMGGPMPPHLGGGMNCSINGPLGNGLSGPMNGGMNINMACSMTINNNMVSSGPGMPMASMNTPNSMAMNGPNNMPCSMSGAMPNGPNMGQKPMPVSSGKVYPSDQPMVFNPQNPNAPPIYPCGLCHKEVHDNDQAILCESGCNFWFHRACTGLTEFAYHQLTGEVYAEWVCDTCLRSKNIPLVKFKP